MKKYLVGAAVAALAFPTAALADEPYIGLSGSFSLPGDSDNAGEFTSTVPATSDWGEIPSGTSVGWTTEFDTGFEISGVAGYAFDNGLRGELQLSYTQNDVDTHFGLEAGGANIDAVDVAVLTRGAPDAANPTVGQVIADGQGNISTFGAFANVFYDINKGGDVEPYIGAGIGYQSVNVEFTPSGVDVADDSDGVFAWQAIAGLNVAVSNNVSLFGQYTYRSGFGDADINLNLLPATLGVETSASLFSLGVRFGLGQ